MQFTIQAGKLAAALKPVCAVVNAKAVMEQLKCVKLSAQDQQLSLMGTDLEQQIELKLTDGVQVLEAGEVLVDAARLRGVVSALPPTAEIVGKVRQESDAEFRLKRLELRFGRARYTFDCQSLEDYPDSRTPEDVHEAKVFSLTKTELLGLINEVQHAMAKQDVRYYLNGILFEARDGLLTVVATDGHRLSASMMPSPLNTEMEAIVSTATIKTLPSLPMPDSFSLTFYPNMVLLSGDNLNYASKLVDGKYPDYRRVIPDESTYQHAVVAVKPFREALSRLDAVGEQTLTGLRKPLSFKLAKELEMNVGDAGHEVIELTSYDGEDMEIGVNIEYIVDCLKAIDGDNLTVGVRDANSAVTFRWKDDNINIVMPLRL